ncbi:MAG: FAD-dependent oxidoreductase [Anaerolineales bacterium]
MGGGATGCGIALDAAARGLRVALVELEDFGSGTSSRSTKLIHGGVRYLELAFKRLDRVQYRLVRDALRERSILLRIAPHLTWWLPLFTPLYRAYQVPYYWAGLKLYDALAGAAGGIPSRFVFNREARALFPQVKTEGLLGGVLYGDGQFDDARMNVTLALTAIGQGAAVANYVEVVGLIQREGQTVGAAVQDRVSGGAWEIEARRVINASGPWSDRLRQMENASAEPILQVSSGAHIVVDGTFSIPEAGLLIPRTEDGRVLFILPWLGSTLIGTTDEAASPAEAPLASDAAVEYLLRHANRYLARRVERTDIRATWAGLRPLIRDPRATDTAGLARDHVIVESPGGMITIGGGKWTTYRKMAEDTVDYAIRHADLEAAAPSRTASLPLVGADGFDPAGAKQLETHHRLDPDVAHHLLRAYGGRAEQVAALLTQVGPARLAPGHPYLEAEVVWAARHELAQAALDVLARRTRLAFLDQAAAEAALPRVVELLAAELGWDAERRGREMVDALKRIGTGI